MAKEVEARIRNAFGAWLRTSSDLVTLATDAKRIRADNPNVPIVVPCAVFQLSTQPLDTHNDSIMLSYATVTVFHADKASALTMIGCVKELARQTNNRDASFSDTYVATLGIAWIGSDEGAATLRSAGSDASLENVFQCEAQVRWIWRELPQA